jgi:hypothetical protein
MPDNPSTAVERYDQPRGAVALSDRDMRSIEFQARTIAFLDPRIKSRPPEERDAIGIAMAITLYNYGLPITVTNGKKLHLIKDEPVESAQLLIGLLEMAGHEVRPVEMTDERCTLHGWRHGTGRPYEMTYTVEQAVESGALDEWVEKWSKNGDRWKLDERITIRRAGVDLNTPWPDWAAEQVAAGRVKRNDAWWNYRADMLGNRCARRLAKWMGSDALLGVGLGPLSEDEPRLDPQPPDGERYRPADVDEDDFDPSIEVIEVLEDQALDDVSAEMTAANPVPPAPPPADADTATASSEWVGELLTRCQDLALPGVRPGALASAIVRHVTGGERSEPATLRRGDEQAAAIEILGQVAEHRWEVAIIRGDAILVEPGPGPEAVQ